MERPSPTFKGSEPYIFVSYSHEDADEVYPEISGLGDAGFNIWYDEGISPGASWRDELAHAIEQCSLFLFFVTNKSVESQYCLQEVSYAQDNSRRILVVYLEDIELSGGLALSLLDRQAIKKTHYNEVSYQQKLHEAIHDIAEELPPTQLHSRPAKHAKAKGLSATRMKAVIGVGILLVITSAAYYYATRSELTDADILPLFEKSVVASHASIAVLPFSNMTGETDQEYFGDGIAEEVLNRLTRIRDLKVISRTSSFNMRNSELPTRQIGEQLGPEFLLEGSIRRRENEIRVTAQLIQTSKDAHVWSETYDAPLDDLFGIQDKIAQAIVYKIKRKVASASTFETPPPTTVMSAYDAFLIGMTAKHSGQESEAILHFERALSLDPNFAEVYLGLSWAYWQLIVKRGLQPDLLKKQIDYAEQAYALKPDAPQIVGALCRARLAEGRWLEAEKLCLEALQLNPKMVSVVRTYCWLLLITGRAQEYARVAEGHDFNWESYMNAQYFLQTQQYEKLVEMGPRSLAENKVTDLRFILFGALANEDQQFLADYLLHMTDIQIDMHDNTWTEYVSQVLDHLDAQEVRLGPNLRIAFEVQAGNIDRAFEMIATVVPFFLFGNASVNPMTKDPRWQTYLDDLAVNEISNRQLVENSKQIKHEINYIDPWD
jgi:TolB-like protein